MILRVFASFVAIFALSACGLSQSPTTPAAQNSTKGTGSYPNSTYVMTQSKPLEPAVFGGADSKVKLSIFTDYQCPACGVFHRSIEDKLWKSYIDTGRVTATFYNFPLTFDVAAGGPLHPNAEGDALASLCALSAGKFREYRDGLYALENAAFQAKKNGKSVSDGERIELARKVGISDVADFEKCLVGARYQKTLESEIAEGVRSRVNGTPTILINGAQVQYDSPEQFFTILDGAVGK